MAIFPKNYENCPTAGEWGRRPQTLVCVRRRQGLALSSSPFLTKSLLAPLLML